MIGTDGDEGAAACSGDDAIDGQLGIDDDLVARHLDRPGPDLERPIDRRRTAKADRIVGRDTARRPCESAFAHQVHRGRPVRVAVQERPDDPSVEDVVECRMVGEWLPLGAEFAGDAWYLAALDPQAVLVRRPASEAPGGRAELDLEARFAQECQRRR